MSWRLISGALPNDDKSIDDIEKLIGEDNYNLLLNNGYEVIKRI